MPRRSRTIIGLLAVFAALLLGGCNTIEGIGEDLSAVGRGIADAANGVQNNF
ncbi:MAG: entericidin A/B family lipoprotein [Phycisphaerales bacterium]|nr:entericidin A/B family lipoprotein [Phycisphaerales bacterium]